MLTFMFHVKQILGRNDKTGVFHVELLGASSSIFRRQFQFADTEYFTWNYRRLPFR
jgi:hypothetical protein